MIFIKLESDKNIQVLYKSMCTKNTWKLHLKIRFGCAEITSIKCQISMWGIKMFFLTEIVLTVFIVLILSRIRKINFLFHLDVFKSVEYYVHTTEKKKIILSKLESDKNIQVLHKSLCILKTWKPRLKIRFGRGEIPYIKF